MKIQREGIHAVSRTLFSLNLQEPPQQYLLKEGSFLSENRDTNELREISDSRKYFANSPILACPPCSLSVKVFRTLSRRAGRPSQHVVGHFLLGWPDPS